MTNNREHALTEGIIFPAQCSCGHLFLENYWMASAKEDGIIAFAYCGFCRKRTDIYQPAFIKLKEKLRRIVIEDVPHQFQQRLLEATK